MNNSLGKKDSGIYRTGDVILVNSALGSPGAGWTSINSVTQVGSQSRLGKLLGSSEQFWTTQTVNFGTTNISSVAYGNGVWVAAGANATLRTSTNDGVTWNTQTSNFGTSGISSVAYGNGVWVAGGLNGALRTSTDNAVTWNTQTSNFGTTNIRSVAYGNGVWVAGGFGGASDFGAPLRTSTNDGVTWNTQTSNFIGSGGPSIVSVAYGNGVWVAGGEGGTARISSDTVFNIVASTTVGGYTWWIKT